jgi:hypothetical protein
MAKAKLPRLPRRADERIAKGRGERAEDPRLRQPGDLRIADIERHHQRG